jgi:hypothetical protein
MLLRIKPIAQGASRHMETGKHGENRFVTGVIFTGPCEFDSIRAICYLRNVGRSSPKVRAAGK